MATPHPIDEIRLHRVASAVTLRYSGWNSDMARAFIVEVRSGPHTGWGEFNDFTWRRLFRPERTALWMSRRILGRDATEPSRSLQWLPALPLGNDLWSRGEHRQWRNVREGLSVALYDLAGRISGRSVADLLGGAQRAEAPGMPVVHLSEAGEMARIADVWVRTFGFRHLKLKLSGHEVEDDRSRLQAVREAIGDGVGLQVDYNYGFRTVEDVVRVVADHHRLFRIDVIEDPIRPQYLGLLGLSPYPYLTRAIEPNVMLDGAAYWPNVRRIVRARAADLINHHADRLGGLDLGLKVSRHAEAHGIRSGIGSGGGVAGIKDRALLALASVTGLTRPSETVGWPLYARPEFEGYYGVTGADDLTGGDLRAVRFDGLVSLPVGPGLGFTIDEARLGRTCVGEPIVIRGVRERPRMIGVGR